MDSTGRTKQDSEMDNTGRTKQDSEMDSTGRTKQDSEMDSTGRTKQDSEMDSTRETKQDRKANSYIEDAKKLSVPRFLPTTPHYQHTVGDTAVLECAVENLGNKSVSWRKVSNDKVLTVGFVSFFGDPRFEVEHPPASSLWNLVIRDLRLDDAGVYECQISSKIRHLRHHVTLLVKNETVEKKKTPNIQITGADFIDEGKRLYLICNATATEQPPEDLDWFREGNRLQTSEEKGIYIRKFVTLSTSTIVSILEIKHARLDDGGVYVCRTSSLDVTSFRVNVLNGEKINVKREMDHTQDTERQVQSAAQQIRHHLPTFLFAATVALSLTCLPSQVT